MYINAKRYQYNRLMVNTAMTLLINYYATTRVINSITGNSIFCTRFDCTIDNVVLYNQII